MVVRLSARVQPHWPLFRLRAAEELVRSGLRQGLGRRRLGSPAERLYRCRSHSQEAAGPEQQSCQWPLHALLQHLGHSLFIVLAH